MTRTDWYRRTTWTEDDQREFFARNARSRGPDSKEQYVRIQAETLLGTRRPNLAEAALTLLEQNLRDYPTALFRAATFDAAGRCCASLGKVDEAVAYFRNALSREKEFPGLGTNACFHFAKLVVEAKRENLYDEALSAAEGFGHPVFPAHAYYLNGIRAVVAARDGDGGLAQVHATTALHAAAVRDTGLSHDRGHLGTVADRSTSFHEALELIARWSVGRPTSR
jgi:hypothetical protein